MRLVQAHYLSEAAWINLATVAWQVRSRLRTSLFSLYVAKHTETILTRQISVQEKLVRILEHRLALGGRSPNPRSPWRTSYDPEPSCPARGAKTGGLNSLAQVELDALRRLLQ